MSELDLQLQWSEEAPQQRLDTDRYSGAAVPEEARVAETACAEPPAPVAGEIDRFQLSAARLRELDRSLERIEAQPYPPLVHFLAQLLREGPGWSEVELASEVRGAEAWLAGHLAEWKRCPPVAVDESDEEARSRTIAFNQGLATLTDALHLAQELVLLAAHRHFERAAPLLEAVGQRFNQAQNALFEAEPPFL